MHPDDRLLLAGASVRAAAFSALRAGLRPWGVDLFGDADLRQRCPCSVVPPGRYPDGIAEAFADAPPGPWMYTGALENRPQLVRRLSRLRPLWGNDATVLKQVRSPSAVEARLHQAGVPCPALGSIASEQPPGGRWLVKPLAGAGGRGIAFRTGQRRRKQVYLQKYIEGEACAALYLGDGHDARLLGVTRQLVGADWLHAAPFHYCGSVGPLSLESRLHEAFQRLGTALVEGFQLRGLFGVDCVLRDGVPFPVEVNPRYTASVEVLEYATGTPLLALHRRVFDPAVPEPSAAQPVAETVGKAILFAGTALEFPADGPWQATLLRPAGLWDVPAFADIPLPGTRIDAGRPVLTFFARAAAADAVLDALRQTAADLDRWLYNR